MHAGMIWSCCLWPAAAGRLQVEEGTPFATWQSKGRLQLPMDEASAEMYALASHTLRRAGYEHYEVSPALCAVCAGGWACTLLRRTIIIHRRGRTRALPAQLSAAKHTGAAIRCKRHVAVCVHACKGCTHPPLMTRPTLKMGSRLLRFRRPDQQLCTAGPPQPP